MWLYLPLLPLWRFYYGLCSEGFELWPRQWQCWTLKKMFKSSPKCFTCLSQNLDTPNTQKFKIQPLGVFKVEIPMRIIIYLRGGCQHLMLLDHRLMLENFWCSHLFMNMEVLCKIDHDSSWIGDQQIGGNFLICTGFKLWISSNWWGANNIHGFIILSIGIYYIDFLGGSSHLVWIWTVVYKIENLHIRLDWTVYRS